MHLLIRLIIIASTGHKNDLTPGMKYAYVFILCSAQTVDENKINRPPPPFILVYQSSYPVSDRLFVQVSGIRPDINFRIRLLPDIRLVDIRPIFIFGFLFWLHCWGFKNALWSIYNTKIMR